MKTSRTLTIISILIVSVIVLIFQNCSTKNLSSAPKTEIPRTDRVALEKSQEILDDRIQTKIAQHQVCQNDSNCKSVEYGSRACGGPEEYLIYSELTLSNAEKTELLSLTGEYNTNSEAFNIENNVASICSIVMKPNLVCQNQLCTPQ
jgi:hypothetical protein